MGLQPPGFHAMLGGAIRWNLIPMGSSPCCNRSILSLGSGCRISFTLPWRDSDKYPVSLPRMQQRMWGGQLHCGWVYCYFFAQQNSRFAIYGFWEETESLLLNERVFFFACVSLWRSINIWSHKEQLRYLDALRVHFCVFSLSGFYYAPWAI